MDLMNQNRTAPQAQAQKPHGSGRQASVSGNSIGDQPTPPSDSGTSPNQYASTSGNTGSLTDADTPPQCHAGADGAAPLFGQMRISKDEISYVGDAHWGAILNSISELKRDLGDDEDANEDEAPLSSSANMSTSREPPYSSRNAVAPPSEVMPSSTSGLGFMLGNAQPVTREELIRSVPDKKVADRLLSLWFNSPDPFKGMIHAPTFQEEYKRFWRDPSQTPTMWVGLMFAIISMAASFALRDVDPTKTQAAKVLAEVNKYHSLAASAAVLADFTKPKEYTLECLIIYTAGLRSGNAFVNVWLMIGLITRLSLRMGYHRDAKHYPNISPFQGEMRRRVWSLVSMIDVLISFQLGLPSMVKTIQSDTEPPRNLLDRDFNRATMELPPSRDIDELTPCSYTRAKLGIVRVFANATELSHMTFTPDYETMMKLDSQLEEAKAAVPPLLQMPDITELVTDPAEQLMCRFNLDLLYLKTKMVLHRRHMMTPLAQLSDEEQKLGIGHSRKVCIEAALRVLQHHHTIYAASQPGGQLESVKWYMGSISTHDFLLAAMLICLELSTQLNREQYLPLNPSGYSCPRRMALMEALEKSHQIWTEASRQKRKGDYGLVGNSEGRKGEMIWDETDKAARAMGVMLEKVKGAFGVQAGPGRGSAQSQKSAGLNASSDTVPGSNSAQNTNWSLFPPDVSHFTGRPGAASAGSSALQETAASYNWSDMNGLATLGNPIDPDPSQPSALRNTPNEHATGHSSSALSIDNPIPIGFDPLPNGMDFSTIGDMLGFPPAAGAKSQNGTGSNNAGAFDVPTPHIDWETWDTQMKYNGDSIFQDEANIDDQSAPMNMNTDLFGMNFGSITAGNALIGGTGAVPANALSTLRNVWDDDFGAAAEEGGPATANSTFAMDFDMSLPLDDVSMLPHHGDMNNVDWAKMWQDRRRTGVTPSIDTGAG